MRFLFRFPRRGSVSEAYAICYGYLTGTGSASKVIRRENYRKNWNSSENCFSAVPFVDPDSFGDAFVKRRQVFYNSRINMS